jgi:hypothetical protein
MTRLLKYASHCALKNRASADMFIISPIQEERRERRAGRPPSPLQQKLEERKKMETEEAAQGFGMSKSLR